MTLCEKLYKTESLFKYAGIETARLDAEILLSFSLDIPRYKIITDANMQLGENQIASIDNLVSRRLLHEPIAYITGKKEFYGLELIVDRRVLIPRPDTELLVKLALSLSPKNGTVLDICTGSGAVAVALKHTRPDLNLYASDISAEAVAVACENARLYADDKINIVAGDLFCAFKGMRFDVITANPPYIDFSLCGGLQPELEFEPEIALYSGIKGLNVITKIVSDVVNYLNPDGLLLMEIGYDQGLTVSELCTREKLFCEVKKDMSGHDRVVLIRK